MVRILHFLTVSTVLHCIGRVSIKPTIVLDVWPAMFQHDNFVHTVLDIHDYSFSLSA